MVILRKIKKQIMEIGNGQDLKKMLTRYLNNANIDSNKINYGKGNFSRFCTFTKREAVAGVNCQGIKFELRFL